MDGVKKKISEGLAEALGLSMATAADFVDEFYKNPVAKSDV